jgi:hydrogenase nickel incorporation protein HypA/HybF
LNIAGRIIEIVELEMSRRCLSSLKEVNVRVGAISGIDPGALEFSYEAACTGTALEGSRLNVRLVTPVAKCCDCGGTAEVEDNSFRCPACGSGRLELLEGQEIDIESICAEQSEERSL